MKITFVSTLNSYSWGGSEELWSMAALEALHQGHVVQVVVYKVGELHPKIQHLETMGAFLVVRTWQKSVPLPSFFRRQLLKIKHAAFPQRPVLAIEEMVAFAPDRIVVSQAGTYDISWEFALQHTLAQLKVPYFLISQFNREVSVLSYASLPSLRSLLGDARKMFFVSRRNLEVATRQLAYVLPNATTISNPTNLQKREPLAWPTTDVPHFACVARLDCAFKGQDILLQLLSGEPWKSRPWMLHLYGKGPDEAYLQELILFYGLEKKVILKGQVSDIRTIWKENALLLMVSIGEGTPLALIEAMACGRPAVVTDVGGNEDMILEGTTGFLAEAPSVRSFGNALETAWQRQQDWPKMGSNAFDHVSKVVDPHPELTLLKEIVKA